MSLYDNHKETKDFSGMVQTYKPDENGIKKGPLRGLNPGPPAPKAGIIPLDQADNSDTLISLQQS